MSHQPNKQPTSIDSDRPELTVFRGEDRGESASTDLTELLDAWQAATSRLERTHAQLHEEVSRLTTELEYKNRELARKNRLADLGEMASHVAHEVRNSLTPITLYLSLLRRHLAKDSSGLEVLSSAQAGFAALEATVNDLLAFSASRSPQATTFLLGELMEEITSSITPQLEAQRVGVELDVPPHVTMSADREMVRRATLNLLLNSLDVMPEGGDLVVTACDSDEGVDLEIADSGPGIDNNLLPRLFEPFFTTKESGTGLGLSVVAHVAEAHGGTITGENCPEGGAAFTLFFPHNTTCEAAA